MANLQITDYRKANQILDINTSLRDKQPSWINDIALHINPEQIQINKRSNSSRIDTLRSSSSLKIQEANSDLHLTMTIPFVSGGGSQQKLGDNLLPYPIWNYKLKPLLVQIRKNPLIFINDEFIQNNVDLNLIKNIEAIPFVVESCSLSTVPDLIDTVVLTISACFGNVFNYTPFIAFRRIWKYDFDNKTKDSSGIPYLTLNDKEEYDPSRTDDFLCLNPINSQAFYDYYHYEMSNEAPILKYDNAFSLKYKQYYPVDLKFFSQINVSDTGSYNYNTLNDFVNGKDIEPFFEKISSQTDTSTALSIAVGKDFAVKAKDIFTQFITLSNQRLDYNAKDQRLPINLLLSGIKLAPNINTSGAQFALVARTYTLLNLDPTLVFLPNYISPAHYIGSALTIEFTNNATDLFKATFLSFFGRAFKIIKISEDIYDIAENIGNFVLPTNTENIQLDSLTKFDEETASKVLSDVKKFFTQNLPRDIKLDSLSFDPSLSTSTKAILYTEEEYKISSDSSSQFTTKDSIINSVNFSINRNIAKLTMDYYNYPTIQYLGGSDIIANIHLITTGSKGQDSLFTLQNLYEKVKENTRLFKLNARIEGLIISNSFLTGFGNIENIFLENITTSTIPGSPDTNDIDITMTDVTESKKNFNKLKSFNYVASINSNISTRLLKNFLLTTKEENSGRTELEADNLYSYKTPEDGSDNDSLMRLLPVFRDIEVDKIDNPHAKQFAKLLIKLNEVRPQYFSRTVIANKNGNTVNVQTGVLSDVLTGIGPLPTAANFIASEIMARKYTGPLRNDIISASGRYILAALKRIASLESSGFHTDGGGFVKRSNLDFGLMQLNKSLIGYYDSFLKSSVDLRRKQFSNRKDSSKKLFVTFPYHRIIPDIWDKFFTGQTEDYKTGAIVRYGDGYQEEEDSQNSQNIPSGYLNYDDTTISTYTYGYEYGIYTYLDPLNIYHNALAGALVFFDRYLSIDTDYSDKNGKKITTASELINSIDWINDDYNVIVDKLSILAREYNGSKSKEKYRQDFIGGYGQFYQQSTGILATDLTDVFNDVWEYGENRLDARQEVRKKIDEGEITKKQKDQEIERILERKKLEESIAKRETKIPDFPYILDSLDFIKSLNEIFENRSKTKKDGLTIYGWQEQIKDDLSQISNLSLGILDWSQAIQRFIDDSLIPFIIDNDYFLGDSKSAQEYRNILKDGLNNYNLTGECYPDLNLNNERLCLLDSKNQYKSVNPDFYFYNLNDRKKQRELFEDKYHELIKDLYDSNYYAFKNFTDPKIINNLKDQTNNKPNINKLKLISSSKLTQPKDIVSAANNGNFLPFEFTDETFKEPDKTNHIKIKSDSQHPDPIVARKTNPSRKSISDSTVKTIDPVDIDGEKISSSNALISNKTRTDRNGKTVFIDRGYKDIAQILSNINPKSRDSKEADYFTGSINDIELYLKASIGTVIHDKTPFVAFDLTEAEGKQSSDTNKYLDRYLKNTKLDTSTMRRMYPTFKVYFLEEDGNSNRWNAFDDFFSINQIQEIRIVKEKTNPADLCYITFVDPTGTLTSQKYNNTEDRNLDQKRMGLLDFKTEDTIYENPIRNIMLKDGMSLQVRLGYDNDPNKLPIEFNGRIASIESHNSIVTIIAQSYGTELVQSMKTSSDQPGITSLSYWGNMDTDELLALMMKQPELKHFGMWKYSSPFDISFSEFRADDKRRYSFDILENPADDNIFAPTTEDLAYILRKWIVIYGGSVILAATALTGGLGFAAAAAGLVVGRALGLHGYTFDFTGMTVWDVFRESMMRHPGYIAYPIPYENRMTMFFGLPNSPYIYKDSNSIINGILRNQTTYKQFIKKLSENKDQFSFQPLIENISRVKHSFQNYYVASSQTNLIYNGIKSDFRDTYNKILVHWDGSSIEDADEIQEIELNPHLLENEIRSTPIFSRNINSSLQAIRYGTTALQWECQNLYKGELVMTGEPGVKPYDIITVNDYTNQMYGVVEVGRVIHVLNSETGFTTTIKPDLHTVTNERVNIPTTSAMMSYFILDEAQKASLKEVAGFQNLAIGSSLTAGALQGSSAAIWALAGNPITAWGILIGGSIAAVALDHKIMEWGIKRFPVAMSPLVKNGVPYVYGLNSMIANSTLLESWDIEWSKMKGDFGIAYNKFQKITTALFTPIKQR